MTALLGVHGIAQQHFGPHQLRTQWEPALRDGIQLALGEQALEEFRPELETAFYGDLFRRDSDSDDEGDDTDLTADELDFFEEIGADVASEVDVTSLDSKKGMPRLPAFLANLLTWLDAEFGAAGSALFLGALRQVNRYRRDDDFAVRVRDRVLDSLSRVEVVIGHSLGSVVAVETLASDSDLAIKRLITVGSPLALPSVRHRLRITDPLVMPWANVFDPQDSVACGGGLHPIWSNVEDVRVRHEGDPHRIASYLTARATGAAIIGGAQTRREAGT